MSTQGPYPQQLTPYPYGPPIPSGYYPGPSPFTVPPGAPSRPIFPTLPQADPSDRTRTAIATASDVSRAVVWETELPPHTTPPFWARWLSLQVRAVLNAPSGDAAAALGAAALQTAEGQIQAVTLLPAVAVATNVTQTLITFTVPNGYRLVASEAAVWVHVSAREAAQWRLTVSGDDVVGEIPAVATDAPMRVFAQAKGGQVMAVMARNLDLHSALLVEAYVAGWIYPSLQQDDNLQSTIYGTKLGPSTNGRFTPGDCSRGGGP